MRLLAAAVVLAVLVALPFGLSEYYVSLATRMIILALFAMSLDLLLGYAGLASLGHAAFFHFFRRHVRKGQAESRKKESEFKVFHCFHLAEF